jgi:hypothetical protein
VRVNLLAAVFVDTPLSERLPGKQIEDRRDQLRTKLPIRRVVEPTDVAALAAHIMTNTALTGGNLRHRQRPAADLYVIRFEPCSNAHLSCFVMKVEHPPEGNRFPSLILVFAQPICLCFHNIGHDLPSLQNQLHPFCCYCLLLPWEKYA